jgi:hypothetical protein
MLASLFEQASIPSGRAILVHARLRGIKEQSGEQYRRLADELLLCLLALRPSLLLVPAFTIYGYMSMRIFQGQYAQSEVGRFSEEMRRRGYRRTPDPMYSVLDILGALPAGLDHSRTFGPGTLFDYLEQQQSIVVNVDIPGFYATPVHGVELNHQVPYRFLFDYPGHLQMAGEPWREISYQAYVRKVSPYGTGSYPHYNYPRRSDYLRRQGVITECERPGSHLAWADLNDFCRAIDAALAKDPWFLVDKPEA